MTADVYIVAVDVDDHLQPVRYHLDAVAACCSLQLGAALVFLLVAAHRVGSLEKEEQLSRY